MSLVIAEIDSDSLTSVVEHVFMPPKLPQEAPDGGVEREINSTLCHLLIKAAWAFHHCLSPSQKSAWIHMIKMMVFVWRNVNSPFEEGDLQSALSALTVGGEFPFYFTCFVFFFFF
jgi:hypothetical protein